MTDGRTDGWTEAIAISPSLFKKKKKKKKKRGDKNTICLESITCDPSVYTMAYPNLIYVYL